MGTQNDRSESDEQDEIDASFVPQMHPLPSLHATEHENESCIQPNLHLASLETIDTDQNIQPVANQAMSDVQDEMDDTLDELQSIYNLTPHFQSVASRLARCSPRNQHAFMSYAITACHQMLANNQSSAAATFSFHTQIKDFIREKARSIFLLPEVQAYANPNNQLNHAVPKSWHNLIMSKIKKQPTDYVVEHLPPGFKSNDSAATARVLSLISDLLRHQRNSIRNLILDNIIDNGCYPRKGPVPTIHESAVKFYEDLMPCHHKLTESQIQAQLKTNFALKVRLAHIRIETILVSFLHKSKEKKSQWDLVDHRLDYLRNQTPSFQHKHSQLVWDKDSELFSHRRMWDQIESSKIIMPSLKDVEDALKQDDASREEQTQLTDI